jgi:hypothetical protein
MLKRLIITEILLSFYKERVAMFKCRINSYWLFLITRLRIYFLIATISCICSCTATFEHAKIEVTEDLSSSIVILVSGAPGEGENNGDVDFLEKFSAKSIACGAKVNAYGSDEKKRIFVHSIFSFKTRNEMDAIIRCAALTRTKPTIDILTTESLWKKTYKIQIEMLEYFLKSDSSAFPEKILITLPGKITEINNQSKMRVYNLVHEIAPENRITISLNGANTNDKKEVEDDVESILKNNCPAEDATCREKKHNELETALSQKLSFTITSEKTKFDFPTLLAIFGLLFGSGIVIQIVKVFSNNRNGTSN